MAPRTAVSRKRDRRTMMREAELRKQRQQQQQQQDQHPSTVGEETDNDQCDELMNANDNVLLNGRSSASSSELKYQQIQQRHVFDNTHPPDCPCILRVLARDDLFLPPSMKNTIDTNEKA
ncbi:hypothetical protein IV203_023817 [Nitzschia inconspicua]|uniref:Uncharacterized protein n=1 Tax=Nitzschia inconspicua TaxID=303405 RepID=A0A9K3PCQ7_9STRA|nr:hypothetical protein IV203_023817 [Nitzschia inconspicua]